MTSDIISLDALLHESLLQQDALKLNKAIKNNPRPTQLANVSTEVQETANLMRQWEAKREWSHTHNVLIFTRQKCNCCGAMSKTFDGFFQQYKNNRVRGTFKHEAVRMFELDKPKDVLYRDSCVEICHECADIQQDWPLQED